MPLPTRGFKGYLDKAIKGTADVKIHFTFLTPKCELIPIENVTAADSRKAWEAIDACVAAGNTPIEEDSGYILVDHTWLDTFHDFTPAFQLPVGDANAHVEHSN